MARPRKCRKVCRLPKCAEFTPTEGVTDANEAVILTVDEYESIRLIDLEGCDQEECSERMDVARTTVQLIYTSARRKIAEALVAGKTLRIRGGHYCLHDGEGCRCAGCMRQRGERPDEEKERTTMKTMIPLDETKEAVCVSFGRAPFFLLHDSATGEDLVLENPAADAEGGAGIKAAQFVLDRGAGTVVTVRCGENAGEVFRQAGIKIFKARGTSLKENLEALEAGELEPLTHFHPGFHGLQ